MDSEMEVFAVKTEFVQKYYEALENAPERLLPFYSESSRLTWLGYQDKTAPPLTTLKGIEKEIRSSSQNISSVFIEASHAQLSSQGGILLTVVGGFIKYNQQLRFFQTFLLVQLEETESGYCILDDILRILPSDGSNEWTSSTIHDGNNKPPYTSKFVPEVDSTSYIHDGNTKQTSTSKFIPSVIKNQKASSSYMHDGNTSKASTSIPTPSGEARRKIHVASTDGNKASTSRITPTPSGDTRTKIFVANLPTDVIENDIYTVMQQRFGPVRRGAYGVRKKKYERCSAIVEFQSPQSAHRAVQAGHVTIYEREARIEYGRST